MTNTYLYYRNVYNGTNRRPFIAFAPLQGYTDAVYRRAHWNCVGGVDEYYTPFVRIEKGEARHKELRDTDPARNDGVPTVPQVIARDREEFARLCDTLQQQGWTRIDLNMGCPFPMQVNAGRGSGLLQHPERVEAIVGEMQCRTDVAFSIKMRLGQENPDEGLRLLPIFNDVNLRHITLHPRLGRQQYKGVVDIKAFIHFVEECRQPMLYNGDITGIENGKLRIAYHDEAIALPAKVKGFMIGRGLLAKPWMLSDKEPMEVLREMHSAVFNHAMKNLCGDSQILARLHAFWEYADIDRKLKKAILKATTLPRYREIASPLLHPAGD